MRGETRWALAVGIPAAVLAVAGLLVGEARLFSPGLAVVLFCAGRLVYVRYLEE